jgi:hypothetical protein
MSLDSIFADDRYGGASGVNFDHRDPVEVFARLQVVAEYDVDNSSRQLITTRVPGYPGPWIMAYSSVEKLHLAKGETDIEYSAIVGSRLMATMAPGSGVWFDRSFPGGRQILLPAHDLTVPDLSDMD